MKKIVIGVSGASGIPIAEAVLKNLKKNPDYTSLLVMTEGAVRTLETESEYTAESFQALADQVFDIKNIGASIASGTFQTEGMIIVPCSMKTAAGIASGYSDNLLLRAADVTLKERRPLVLVAREAPFHSIHLRNLYELSQAGAIILPPMLTYYNHPETIQDMTNHIAGKILDIFGIEGEDFRRWR
ncbi:MAG: UbiX family flavin prenyltransferase [Lachnospiraceae bacterium]|jgi:4-hydroxy-3-polyprenylbenzoate decarboxylase|nr:UbiX family flavin prenyltransferase [Lachnospiraceae bacterium]MCI1657524.1 UbiX family flavin prenyltransferase [Lachnospiraceae bacterium]MCI2195939.1 UbiX family flavin prenyltransferase [Lachnospiraceae bacterium]